jgi:LptD protein
VTRRLAALLLLGVGAPAGAQIIPQRFPGIQSIRPGVGRDSLRSDSTIMKWASPDSAMQALLTRQGYVVTKYQGEKASFDPGTRVLDLTAPKGGKAAVQRASQTFVSDSGIFYDDSTRRAFLGGNYAVSDPASGQADVIGNGLAEYDIVKRFARVPHGRFAANLGDMWFLSWTNAAVSADTGAAKGATLYAVKGAMTSCNDTIPDYRFEFGEAKRTSSNTIIARPAIMYIKDIPVLWLPFIFSDTRAGRHSGILSPRFGFGDIVRNSPSYHRNVENVGYYFALDDYMGAAVWLDWRSGSGGNGSFDPGWLKYSAEWDYKWINRFLAGRLASTYTNQNNGQTNLAVSWAHQQEFSKNSHLTTNANWVKSTTLQRQNTFDPLSVLATISSAATYTQKIGPANISLGGTSKQYPGRKQYDLSYPALSVTTGPLGGSWLVWTPSLSYNTAKTLQIDQPGIFQYRYVTGPAGQADSTRLLRNAFTGNTTFDTPIRIFGYDIRQSFRINQTRSDFPEEGKLYDFKTGEVIGTKVFSQTFRQEVNWNPEFALPPIFRNRLNITPSLGFSNADPGPFWLMTERTNGRYVVQKKRPTFGMSAAPTIFGLFGGRGPFEAFRHTISPTLTYTYAPRASVSDAYIAAAHGTSKGYLGSLMQNRVTLGLSQTFEAKLKVPSDTSANPQQGQKIKLLSIQFSPITYDFALADSLRRAGQSWVRGITTQDFDYTLRSDLLPGFDFSSRYSLFQGSTLSDTAKFAPFLESISANVNLSRGENPLVVLTRLFGKAVPEARTGPTPGVQQVTPRLDDTLTQRIAAQPVAGNTQGRGERFLIPQSQGWRVTLNFSHSHPRPPVGGNVVDFDPRVRCEQIAQGNPFLFDACLEQLRIAPTAEIPVESTTLGGTVYNLPATTTLGGTVGLNLTPKWTAAWRTTYDFERSEFASQVVQLQRDLHDWRASFGFTQSPNGNFAFNFTIALKANQDIKFDYNRATVRSGAGF